MALRPICPACNTEKSYVEIEGRWQCSMPTCMMNRGEFAMIKRRSSLGAFDATMQKVKNTPYCPVHQMNPMIYEPADDRWVCPDANCTRWARKRVKFTDLFDQDATTPPIYRGKIELVQDEDGRTYLYLVDANGMVDVTGLMDTTM